MSIFVSFPVDDVVRAKAFYSALGLTMNEAISVGGTEDLVGGSGTPSPVTLSWALDSREEVDALLGRAEKAGARIGDTDDYGFMYQRQFDDPEGYHRLAQVRMALSQLKAAHPEYAPLLLTMNNLEDADWENNWKQFYKPMEIGERLIVVPEWEQANTQGRIPLILNPGLTFGTGSHATTRLCLTALEKHVRGGETVLDLGCGSGILITFLILCGIVAVIFFLLPTFIVFAAVGAIVLFIMRLFMGF